MLSIHMCACMYLGLVWWEQKEWNLKYLVSSSIPCCLVRFKKNETWNPQVSSSTLTPRNLNPPIYEGDQFDPWGSTFNLKINKFVIIFLWRRLSTYCSLLLLFSFSSPTPAALICSSSISDANPSLFARLLFSVHLPSPTQALALSPASLLCSPFISDALFVGRSSISYAGVSCFCCDAASPLLLGICCCFSSPSLDFDFLGISSPFLRCLLMMVRKTPHKHIRGKQENVVL